MTTAKRLADLWSRQRDQYPQPVPWDLCGPFVPLRIALNFVSTCSQLGIAIDDIGIWEFVPTDGHAEWGQGGGPGAARGGMFSECCDTGWGWGTASQLRQGIVAQNAAAADYIRSIFNEAAFRTIGGENLFVEFGHGIARPSREEIENRAKPMGEVSSSARKDAEKSKGKSRRVPSIVTWLGWLLLIALCLWQISVNGVPAHIVWTTAMIVAATLILRVSDWLKRKERTVDVTFSTRSALNKIAGRCVQRSRHRSYLPL